MEVAKLEKILELHDEATAQEFIGDNMQLMKETSNKSAIIIDRVNNLMHSVKTDNRLNQIEGGVEVKSMAIDDLQYVTSYMTAVQLKALLDKLVTANAITAQRRTDILVMFG